MKDIFIKILGILAAIGAFISTIFIMLFNSSKKENEEIKKDLDEIKETANSNAIIAEAEHYATEKLNEGKTKNENLIQKSKSGNTLSNFNSSIELLRK